MAELKPTAPPYPDILLENTVITDEIKYNVMSDEAVERCPPIPVSSEVEQLADQAGEESVLLTASVSEGTLCHLGSTSGRFFLEGHEDFKSKFLGFCLKRHHKQHEELEVKTAPVPAYVMKCPKKLPSHKGQWSATHKPYQRRHVTPKFTKPRVQLRAPKVHLHTEHEFQPNINGDNMEENLVLQSDATGIPSVTNSVHSDQTVNFNTSHSDEPNLLSRMEFEGGHIEFEGGLPTSTDNSSHSEAPKGSYTEADTAVERAEESYREVVRIKQEPQTDNDDEQEVANMVYSVGAEGSQMAAPDWNTNIAGLGPEFDTGSLAGQEADNPQLSNMSYAGHQFSGGGRKVRQYPKSAMKAALDAVRSGVMRKSQAAMYFDDDMVEDIKKEPVLFSKKQKRRTNIDRARYISTNTPCRICGKIVKRAGDLSKHMRTHTGIKPFSCDYCGRKFSQSSSLNTHRRLHTGERPYSCAVCNERFGRRDSMIHHHQKYHRT